jgi:hypothetical protein
MGKVQSVDASGNVFTLKDRSGATITVDVNSSTTYDDQTVSSPTIANVTVGEQVGVIGTESSDTVAATEVHIGGPGGPGGPGHGSGSGVVGPIG